MFCGRLPAARLALLMCPRIMMDGAGIVRVGISRVACSAVAVPSAAIPAAGKVTAGAASGAWEAAPFANHLLMLRSEAGCLPL